MSQLTDLSKILGNIKQAKDIIDIHEGRTSSGQSHPNPQPQQQPQVVQETIVPQHNSTYGDLSDVNLAPDKYINNLSKSKLPDFIKESLAKTPPNAGVQMGTGLTKEQINQVNPNRNQQSSRPQKVITENYTPQQNNITNTTDVRKIVREELEYMFEKYMSKKSNLNESMNITENEIKFIQGDYVYFAEIYDKKKLN